MIEDNKVFNEHLNIRAVRDNANLDHVKSMLKQIRNNHELSDVQKEKIFELIMKYSDIFSKYKGEIGTCNVLEHEIVTKPIAPINLRQRQIPIGQQAEVNRQIESMLKHGVISPSESPWNALIVIVRKKTEI